MFARANRYQRLIIGVLCILCFGYFFSSISTNPSILTSICQNFADDQPSKQDSVELNLVETVMTYCRDDIMRKFNTSTISKFNLEYGNCVLLSLKRFNILQKKVRLQFPFYPYRNKTDHVFERFPLRYSDKKVTAEQLNKFLQQPVINVHNYSYLNNPKFTCQKEGNVDVLFIVPSAPGNFQRRKDVRSGIRGDYVRDKRNKAKMLFFIGAPSQSDPSEMQMKINRELGEHGDMVQEDFEDIYTNIRLKSMMMLKWASTYCTSARFVIRMDDDIIIQSVDALVSALKNAAKNNTNFILGNKLIYWLPHRNNCSKYFVTEEQWDDYIYPPGFQGGLLGMPQKTVGLLYQATLRTKTLWLDDVWVTGICRSKIGAFLLTDPYFHFEHRKPEKDTWTRECRRSYGDGEKIEGDGQEVEKEISEKETAQKVAEENSQENQGNGRLLPSGLIQFVDDPH